MNRIQHMMIAAGLILLLVWAGTAPGAETGPASGTIVDGIRDLPIPGDAQDLAVRVYRGDYVHFRLIGSDATPVLAIPDLGVRRTLTPDPADYVKMEVSGAFAFTLGSARGTITVVDFRESAYREVGPSEFAAMLADKGSVLLDVRTPGEYARGHISGSTLIPLQQLQARLGELAAYKDRTLLIYCATGNRSTVASRLLIDSGYKRVVNLRPGIAGWEREKLPIEK
jgi:rhodanese-related sulfurtransferase